jgi:hypothetical protein
VSAAAETLDAVLARDAQNLKYRVYLLAAAAGGGDATLRKSLVARALNLIPAIADDEDRTRALSSLAQELADEEWAVAETLTGTIPDAFLRANLFADFAAAQESEDDAREQVMRAINEIPRFVESNSLSVDQQAQIVGARALPCIAKGEAVDGALSVIDTFEDKTLAALALANIAPRLPGELAPRAVEMADRWPAGERALLALAKTSIGTAAAGLRGRALDSALEDKTDLLHDRTLAPVAEEIAKLPSDLLT